MGFKSGIDTVYEIILKHVGLDFTNEQLPTTLTYKEDISK